MSSTATSWEPLLTPPEAGAFLQVHEKTAIRFARDGVIPAIRLGGKLWRFRRSDLEAWAAATVSSPRHPNE
jgi:excisionase family DNA binding protein